MKQKGMARLLAAGLLAALVLTGCRAEKPVQRLRMGVAGEGGVYYELGQAYAARAEDVGSIQVKTTAGSAANLRLLSGDYLQLAIAQADLVQEAYQHTGIFRDEEEGSGFGAVAALYTEACQVVVRADSGIESVEQLQGRTVSIGAEDSGTEQNALQILAAYGLNEKLVSTVNLNYEDAAAQLKAGKIDGLFITAGAPSPVLTQLAEECELRWLNVDGTAAQRLTAAYSAYSAVTLPADTYPGQTEEVRTVGVKAVLLAADRLSAKQVQQLTGLLFARQEELEQELGIRLDREADAVEGVGIPFHPGAAAYYKEKGLTVE